MADFRWKHFAAMALIGDGVMAMIRPEHEVQAWKMGPEPWQRLMRGLRKRPGLTRLLGAAQVAGGICWALRTEKEGKRFAPPHDAMKQDDVEEPTPAVPVR